MRLNRVAFWLAGSFSERVFFSWLWIMTFSNFLSDRFMQLRYCFTAHLLTIRMQFSAIRSQDLAGDRGENGPFLAKATALDDLEVCPRGWVIHIRPKCCHAVEKWLISPCSVLSQKDAGLHSSTCSDKCFIDAYADLHMQISFRYPLINNWLCDYHLKQGGVKCASCLRIWADCLSFWIGRGIVVRRIFNEFIAFYLFPLPPKLIYTLNWQPKFKPVALIGCTVDTALSEVSSG